MHQWRLFDAMFIAMYVACFLIRAPLEAWNKKLGSVGSHSGALEKFCLLLVFTGSTTMPLLYLFTPWFDFASYMVSAGVGSAGCVLAVVGVALFWKTHHDLGRQFAPTLELRESHQLVCSGIYSRIRHPMYTAIFIIAAAQCCLLGNAVAGPAFLLAFSILYLARIDNEERMLLGHFGQAYADYQARTGRLLPPLRR